MRSLNQKGQMALFFVFIMPLLVLMLLTTVKFSKIVFTKMKLQGSLDQATYAGASYLTEVLNHIALLNWEAHKKFLNLERYFRINSKPSEAEAKRQIKDLWEEQNKLYDVMAELGKQAYAKAYAIANQVLQKDFPKASLIPLYQAPPIFWDGPRVDFSFDKIKGGVIFDPTGHQKVPKADFEARMAFVKDSGRIVAFAAGAQVEGFPSPLKAVAAAQPYGGSIWNFAHNPNKTDESFLYRTAMVPIKTLPLEGFTYEVHH